MNKTLLLFIFTIVFLARAQAIEVNTQIPHSNYSIALHRNTYQRSFENPADTGKNQVIAALLAYFLGNYGIHSFYLGYKKRGQQQLTLSLGGIALTMLGTAGTYIFAALASSSGSDGFAIMTIVSIILIVVGAIMGIIAWIWGLVDFIKILTGDLKPAGGDYEGPDWF